MIEFSGKSYFHGIWFCGDSENFDFMGALFRPLDGNKWHFLYRFRHYDKDNPGKVWDSKDTKNWYELTTPAEDSNTPPPKLLEVIAEIVNKGRELFGVVVSDFIDLRCLGDDPKVFFELGSREWANMKLEKEQVK